MAVVGGGGIANPKQNAEKATLSIWTTDRCSPKEIVCNLLLLWWHTRSPFASVLLLPLLLISFYHKEEEKNTNLSDFTAVFFLPCYYSCPNCDLHARTHRHTHTHHHTTCIHIILLTYSLSPSRREKKSSHQNNYLSMGTNKNDIFLCIHRHTQKLYNVVSSVAYRKRKETEKVAFPQHNSSSSWLSYSPQPPCSKNTVLSKCYCFFLIVSYNSYLSGFIL